MTNFESGDSSKIVQTEDATFDHILNEIGDRLNAGEDVDIDDYIRKVPECSDRIRRAIPGLKALVELGYSKELKSNETSRAGGFDRVRELGDYRILGEIGRGGMGVVYEAVQVSLSRNVALKILPFASVLDQRRLERFKNEALASASLKHPNIVGVYSVGCERGVHFYAMELVDGQNLAEVIDQLRCLDVGARFEEHRNESHDSVSVSSNDSKDFRSHIGARSEPKATVRQIATGNLRSENPTRPMASLSTEYSSARENFFRSVARIGVQAAEALDYAHQMGIVHRDIKPSNLMLNRDGQLCITDFGLATTRSDESLTLTGDLLGTARYMSPEQASGGHTVLDHRTDIYSLGLTLYELLTLSPAFCANDPRQVLRHIEEDQPRAPRLLDRFIPKDLETVILKATSKDRDGRYSSAQQFADDLNRFLEHQPVMARRVNQVERLWRWGKRNRTLASFMLATICLMAALATVGPMAAWRQSVLKDRAVALNESLRQRDRTLQHYLYDARIVAAHTALQRGDAERADELLRMYAPQEGDEDLRGFEWYYLWRESRRTIQSPTIPNWTSVFSLAYSPDGRYFAFADWHGNLHLCDAKTKATVWQGASGKGHTDTVYDLQFCPTNQVVASASKDKTALLWDVKTGQVLKRLGPFSSQVVSVAFSHGGRLLAVGLEEPDIPQPAASHNIRLYRLERPAEGDLSQLEAKFHSFLPGCNGRVQSLSFSCDGEWVAAACKADSVYLWKVANGSPVHETPSIREGVVQCVQFSPKQRGVLAIGIGNARTDSTWGELRVWDLSANSELAVKRFDAPVHRLAFSRNGAKLAAADEGRTMRVWSANHAYALVDTVRGHSARVNDLALSVDGSTLASGGSDNKTVFWDVSGQREVESIEAHNGAVLHLDFNTTGNIIVSGGADGTARIFDTRTGNQLGEFPTNVREVLSVDVSPDNSTVAVAGSFWPGQTPGELCLWDMVGKAKLHRLYEGPDMVWSARFSPDGDKIAAAFDRWKSNNSDKKGTLVIWNAQTGQRIREFVVQPARHVRQLAWSPDGKRIATISMHRDETNQHGPVQLWDCATTTSETLFGNPNGDLLVSLAYSGDGKTIAAGSHDGTIHLWQISEGAPTDKPGRVLTGHSSSVWHMEFSPNCRRLVSCGSDGTVRVWNVVTGAEELVFRESPWIWCARFSHDGRTLAVGTSHLKAKIFFFRAASDQQVAKGLLDRSN